MYFVRVIPLMKKKILLEKWTFVQCLSLMFFFITLRKIYFLDKDVLKCKIFLFSMHVSKIKLTTTIRKKDVLKKKNHAFYILDKNWVNMVLFHCCLLWLLMLVLLFLPPPVTATVQMHSCFIYWGKVWVCHRLVI